MDISDGGSDGGDGGGSRGSSDIDGCWVGVVGGSIPTSCRLRLRCAFKCLSSSPPPPLCPYPTLSG